jgi:hypothetical protein
MSTSQSKSRFSKAKAESIVQSIEDLMEIRAIARRYAPDFAINNPQDERTMQKLLKRVGKHLIPLFEEQGLCGQAASIIPPMSLDNTTQVQNQQLNGSFPSAVIESGLELMEKIGDAYIFVGSNSVKKKLKGLGIEPIKIIATGGPVTIEDLKKVNPNIPEAGLQGYLKKLENVYKELQAAVASKKPIFFAQGLGEETDQMIADRLSMIEKKISGSFLRLIVRSWDKI